MNQKKNIKIVIILIIITLILILIGGVAFAYLATDIFKSDKERFFQYMAQIGDEKEGMIENSFKEYLDKKKTTPYTNEGTFHTKITSENEQEKFKNLNQFNITFSGQVDTANAKLAQEISLNYSDSVNFPISYKQIGNTIGLQTKYIGSKFIAVETDNLNKLSGDTINSIEETVSAIQEIQEITQIQLTEEMEQIQKVYGEILNQKLNHDKFSKIKEANRNGYQLSLTGEELKDILIQLLETLKDDQTTLDKLNEYLKTQKNSAKITTNDIEEQIDNINNSSDIENEKLELTVYEKNRKVVGISITTNEINMAIQKEDNKDELKYHITLESNDNSNTNQINFDVGYTGVNTMQKIKESYSLGYKTSDSETQYTLENNIDLTISNKIEEFSDENSMILTNYKPEQVNNFLQAVTERITQVNKQQMEELGLKENENPFLIGIIMPLTETNAKLSAYDPINQTAMSETEITAFNEKFEMYASTNLKGVTVKGLLSTISLNNESQDKERQIKEIHFKGEEYEASEQNLIFIKEDIDTEKSYRVEFEKDQDTGIIYRVVINEK